MRFWSAIALLLLLTPSVALSDPPRDIYYEQPNYQFGFVELTTSLFGSNQQYVIDPNIRIHTEGGVTTFDIFNGAYECGNTVCGAWQTVVEIPLENNFVWQSSNWTEFAISRNFTSGDVSYFGEYFPSNNTYLEVRYEEAIDYTLTLAVDTITGITQWFEFRNEALSAKGDYSQNAAFVIGEDPMILQSALYERGVAEKRQRDTLAFLIGIGVVVFVGLLIAIVRKLFT